MSLRTAPLLISLAALLASCGDQMLPPEEPGAIAGKIVYSEIDDPDYWGACRLISIDVSGDNRIDAGVGMIASPPAATGRAAVTSNEADVLVSDVAARAQSVRVAGSAIPSNIDPFSVAISPDGSKIAYRIGMASYISNADGSGAVAIPMIARESTPRFSPDSRTLAFYTREADSTPSADPTGKRSFLNIISTDGSNFRQLEEVGDVGHDGWSTIDWSPDGAHIVYNATRAGELAMVDRGGTSYVLTAGTAGIWPAWSPDGTTIAYVGYEDGELYTIPVLGGTARRLTSTPLIYESYPQWSPDGKHLLATMVTEKVNETPGSLTVIDVATGSSRTIVAQAYRAFWTK